MTIITGQSSERRAGSITLTTAKRALSFGKTYLLISAILTIIAISLSFGVFPDITSLLNVNSKFPDIGNSISLFESTFGLMATLMLVTPIIILFVYDKNNGVLEYLLSLGMSPRNIYMHYLIAALFLVSIYLIVFVTANLSLYYIVPGTGNIYMIFTVLFLAIILSISVVAFVITAMMVFSSLQKSRAGGNQPLVLSIGSIVGVMPGLLFVFIFPFDTAVTAEILQATVIAIAFFALFLFSGRLIKREKFLP